MRPAGISTDHPMSHVAANETTLCASLELSHKTWPQLGYSGANYGDWYRVACGWDDSVQLGAKASPA